MSAWSHLLPTTCQNGLLSSIVFLFLLHCLCACDPSTPHHQYLALVYYPYCHFNLRIICSYWYSSWVFLVLAVKFPWDMQCEELLLIHSASLNCFFWWRFKKSKVRKKPLSATSRLGWLLFYLIFMDSWEGRLSKGKGIPSLLENL